MTRNEIISTITAFGFTQNSKNKNIYLKKEFNNLQYQITIDFIKSRIDFGDEIKKGDETTSHLKNSENIVVLECVSRLLEKGYKPADLTLEKRWKLGRTTKSGKADITVQGKDGRTLLIIECKTWGKEYEKELANTKQSGGQIFSYFQQDKNARYLCIYTSQKNKRNIENAYSLIKVEDSTEEKIKQQETEKLITYEQAKTIKEMLEVWKHKTKNKQTFLATGLFEPEIEPYNPGYIPLKISDLKDFGKEDKGKVFNQFEEILRHNNISDRSNAFNRIISLILAKIVDENKGKEVITDFQLKEGIDDAETLLERLQSLYAKAMRDYLDEEVIDYKLEDIEAQIENFPRQTAKETLYRIYKELKFYQNNEFAFKEVYNKKLFEENAKVLEEVVRLFQQYRFKYDQKAQFLGDFFELLLETGYKQSEGQFFTPTPIARFIISSIPLKEVIKEKLQKGEKQFLPKVVDFACGSGHFLTEAIARIADLVKEMDRSEIEDEKSVLELKRYQEDMRWAGEYIFGIEKDYRLARTSQVACFMHGDGDANIIFGDGLEKHDRLGKDGTFDVLIANPPYTIKDFKKHLNVNPHNFKMWEHVTPDSDDIEVFFVERMKQLLRPGGMAGIVLPSSILSNAGVYTKAREIILKHFEVKAIVEFGGNTFGATGTNTVTLYLKKRNEDFVTNCQYIAEDFIAENKKREGDFLNSQELFENYIRHLKLEPDDYKTFTARKPNAVIKASDFYKNYKGWFDSLTEVANLKKRRTFKELGKTEQEEKLNTMFFEMVLGLETEKLFYYLLTHRLEEDPEHFGLYDDPDDGTPVKIAYPQKKAVPQTTLICKTGSSTREQEKFLGYKFSNRRGYKGIDFTGKTLMFDETTPLSPQKVNSYICKNFKDEKVKIDAGLANNLSLVRLNDCIDFDKIDFDKRISSSIANPIVIETKYQLTPLKNLLTDIESGNRPKGGVRAYSEGIPSLGGEHIGTNGKLNLADLKFVPVDFYKSSNKGKIRVGDILICKDGALTGKVARVSKTFFYKDAMINEHVFILRSNEKILKQGYLFQFLYSEEGQSLLEANITGQAQGGLNQANLFSIKIPVPPLDIQQKIIEEIEAIEQKEAKAKKVVEEKREEIDQLFTDKHKNTYNDILGNICELKAGKFVSAKDIYPEMSEGLYPCYGGNGLRGYTETYTHKGEFPLVGRQGALCGNVHLVHGTFHATEHALVATPKKGINAVWLYHLLRIMDLNQYARGVAQPGLSVKYLYPISVRVLPGADQLKVVEKIEQIQEEINKQQQSIAHSEEEKKAVLAHYL